MLRLPGVQVTMARFPGLLRLPPHTHERACLTVFLDGAMAERLRGREWHCERAAVLIKPSLERHDDLFGRYGSRQIIVEPLDLDADPFRSFQSLFSSERFQRNGTAERLAHRLASELDHPDPFSTLAASALTYELIVSIARQRGRTPGNRVPPVWLRRTHERLSESHKPAPLLEDLARDAGVHPAYLARSFRAYYGCSIGAFVRQRRLDAAARDLAQPGSTIAGVAAAHGFTDQSHFTRQFRRHLALTPREYQRRLRSE